MVLCRAPGVDRYLAVLMAFMVAGIPISLVSPTTGHLREPPLLPLFYASIAGIAAIVLYGAYRERQRRRAENARRKRPRK